MKLLRGMATAAALTAMSFSANAAIITFHAGTAAQLAIIESDFLNTLEKKAMEGFDGLASNTSYGSANQQENWEASKTSFNTEVGKFTLAQAGKDYAGADEHAKLKIESNATGEHGREALASDSSDLWLDSNDAKKVKWDIAVDPAFSFDALGFYLADPNDAGAELRLRLRDGSTTLGAKKIVGGVPNASLFYVTVVSDVAIVGADLIFQNCDDDPSISGPCNATNRFGSDGWGIDDATVGKIPEPGTLALLGMGLAGLGLARKKAKA